MPQQEGLNDGGGLVERRSWAQRGDLSGCETEGSCVRCGVGLYGWAGQNQGRVLTNQNQETF